jgi:glycine dehydrogenase subunit 1
MRFSPHTDAERRAMLAAIGVDRLEDLFRDVPAEVRLDRPLDLPAGMPEMALMPHLSGLARRNRDLTQAIAFVGGGAYDRFIPSAVDAILRRGEFYTSYTPYQPEISQGMLQAIFEFQSYIAELTGLDVAQASLYDGATAVAEAAMMAAAETRRRRIVVSRGVDPQYRQVLATYAFGQDLEVVEVELDGDGTDEAALRRAVDESTAAVVLQHPNFLGSLEDPHLVGEVAHAAGALFIMAVEPVSLALLRPPGELGADVAVGEGQSLGIPPAFGGPYLGFLAARAALVRRLPGRIVGATVDREGRRGYVLTLQTREQHIRRERATSNICTNQGLMALAATVYLALMGPEGLRRAAALSLEGAHSLAAGIARLPGWRVINRRPFLQEFVAVGPLPADRVNDRLAEWGIIGGLPLGRDYPEFGPNAALLCVTEKRTPADIERMLEALEAITAEGGEAR